MARSSVASTGTAGRRGTGMRGASTDAGFLGERDRAVSMGGPEDGRHPRALLGAREPDADRSQRQVREDGVRLELADEPRVLARVVREPDVERELRRSLAPRRTRHLRAGAP